MRLIPVLPATVILAATMMLLTVVADAEPFVPEQFQVDLTLWDWVVLGPDDTTHPITISGGPAKVQLMLYSNPYNKEDIVSEWSHRGAGWRYTDRLDTCVYISPSYEFEDGENVFHWDSFEKNGESFQPPSTNRIMTYDISYWLRVWAYANEGQSAAPALPGNTVRLQTTGADGAPLNRPMLITETARWFLGNDPANTSLIETTAFPLDEGWTQSGPPLLEVTDTATYAYVAAYDSTADTYSPSRSVRRYEWVSGGTSILDSGWGEDLHWDVPNISSSSAGSLESDGEYLYLYDYFTDYPEFWRQGKIYILGLESGEMLYDFYIEWLLPPGTDVPLALINTAPPATHFAGGFLHATSPDCRLQMFDMHWYMETEDGKEMFRWINAETTVINPSGNPSVHVASVAGFAEGYQLATITGSPSGTNLLIGPDGTSLGWLDLSDGGTDTVAQALVCDNGSAFDGIYTVHRDASGAMTGIRYRGTKTVHDSADFIYLYDYTGADVIRPNGGEVLVAGTEYTVKWTETYTRKPAISFMPYFSDIYLSVDAGRTWQSLTWGKCGESETITIPTVDSDSCLVRVSCYKAGIEDISDGFFTITAVSSVSDDNIPTAFAVLPASPNPFNPSTAIPVDIPAPGHVRAVVYNLTGQRIAVLADGDFPAGRHTLLWRASGSAAGVYICRVEYGGKTRAAKVTLAK